MPLRPKSGATNCLSWKRGASKHAFQSHLMVMTRCHRCQCDNVFYIVGSLWPHKAIQVLETPRKHVDWQLHVTLKCCKATNPTNSAGVLCVTRIHGLTQWGITHLQVLQRRVKRICEDVRTAVASEVGALMRGGVPRRNGGGWAELMQIFPSSDLLLDELEARSALPHSVQRRLYSCTNNLIHTKQSDTQHAQRFPACTHNQVHFTSRTLGMSLHVWSMEHSYAQCIEPSSDWLLHLFAIDAKRRGRDLTKRIQAKCMALQAVVKILAPFGGPRVRQALSAAFLRAFTEYTGALASQFAAHRDPDGRLPPPLGTQQPSSVKCVLTKHQFLLPRDILQLSPSLSYLRLTWKLAPAMPKLVQRIRLICKLVAMALAAHVSISTAKQWPQSKQKCVTSF